jgi:hypothetical protein
MKRRRSRFAKTGLQLAKELWALDAIQLSRDTFERRWQKLWSQASDIAVLWQLGGAMNDYLRHHPGSLNVRPDLPWILLRSNRRDARIIGLKLLKHCQLPTALVLYEVMIALARPTNDERLGGVHELDNFLSALRAPVAPALKDQVNRLTRLLRKTVKLQRDRIEGKYFASVLDHLQTLQP